MTAADKKKHVKVVAETLEMWEKFVQENTDPEYTKLGADVVSALQKCKDSFKATRGRTGVPTPTAPPSVAAPAAAPAAPAAPAAAPAAAPVAPAAAPVAPAVEQPAATGAGHVCACSGASSSAQEAVNALEVVVEALSASSAANMHIVHAATKMIAAIKSKFPNQPL